MTIVQIEIATPPNEKNELSAMPVMIPGRAIGRMKRNDTDSRPKKLKRWIANDAIVPRTSAMPLASSATFTDSTNASRRSWSCHAVRNQWSDQPGIGQLWMFERLNAYTQMTTIGSQRNATTSAAQTASTARVALVSILR